MPHSCGHSRSCRRQHGPMSNNGALDARMRRQSGQIMVIFALSIVGLVALLALVVDGGNIYVQRRTAVTAADAGALAGTRALKNATASSDVAAIRTDLTTFVQANGFGTQAGVPCAYFVDTAGNPIAGGGIVNAGTVAGCPALTGLIPNGASGLLRRSARGFPESRPPGRPGAAAARGRCWRKTAPVAHS